jgi:hypothetical protein
MSTSIDTHFETLCRQAKLHGCVVKAARSSTTLPHILVAVQRPDTKNLWIRDALERDLSPEDQAREIVEGFESGAFVWPA